MFGALFELCLLGLGLMPASSTPIFHEYQDQATQSLSTLSLDEKIAQILLVRYPDDAGAETLAQYQFGGYVFFAKDFQQKSATEVRKMLADLQSVAKIPILTAVDEEGGLVVRASSNPALVDAPFRSPQALYEEGGLELVQSDTVTKSQFLMNLGLNLNLAPVVDVSTDPRDYMYGRSLGQDATLTSAYAEAVISASRPFPVSYTLKHFPGYGNNSDTHLGSSFDQRSLNDLLRYDLAPFRAGVDAGAEAVLVSHNVVNCLDSKLPASLSASVHQLLRQAMGFSGVIITDDIAMGAVAELPRPTVQALLAGNDLIITTDYAQSFADLKKAVVSGEVTVARLDQAVLRVLAWKYYKGLLN